MVLLLLAGLLVSAVGAPGIATAQVVRYELHTTRGTVNLSGKKPVDFAVMINGSIPAPTLEFTEGDVAEIVLKNGLLEEEVSLHWHGILLPNEMDGVPYIATPPIPPGNSYTFRFPIRQHGTYWYHSHTNVQEQKGVFGALIIHPRNQQIEADREVVLLINDWTDENADRVLTNLKKDGDYYLYKKGTVRSWLGAIQDGMLGKFIENEWSRMGGMDLSDVGYDAFLINGRRTLEVTDLRPGEHVRLRVINGSASSYYYLSLGNTPMKVISADGLDIQPAFADQVLIGMAETYDFLLTVPEKQSVEFRATAQDGTGYASAWIGTGTRIPAREIPTPSLYASMDHSSHANRAPHGNHAGHGTARSSPAAATELLTIDSIRSIAPTTFPAGRPTHELRLVLGGDMSRYVWFINGKAMHEDMNLDVRADQVIRIHFQNDTMMHHPFHLHGHFFRVLNGAGDHSPLKHTVDIPPHASRTIEFLTDEPGRWLLHCHNLFHMTTGMGRVVNYLDFTPALTLTHEQTKHDPHLHDPWFRFQRLELASNHAQASHRMSRTWDDIDLRLETRNSSGTNLSFSDPWEVEADLFYRRWTTIFLNLVGGPTLFDQELSAAAGVGYRLPLLIESQVLVNHRGKIRLDLEKRFQWSSAVFTDVDFTWRPDQARERAEDVEWELSLMFGPTWTWSAGLMLTNESLGAGFEVKF